MPEYHNENIKISLTPILNLKTDENNKTSFSLSGYITLSHISVLDPRTDDPVEKDLRVPISQGQEFYGALKRLGVPAEMVIYPRTQHGPEEPKFIQDIGERIIKWFDEYLKR